MGGASAAVLAFMMAAPASAAEGEAAAGEAEQGLGQIIVTAQHRSEDIQRAAVAITAVTGEELQDRGISQTEQLATLTASLQVQPSAGPYTTFSVRSVSQLSGNAFADPAIAVNYNGVYLATPTVIHGLYYDLERLEILKGPQGTLYGRNATAGAINAIPNRPRFEFEGNASIDVGSYNRLNLGAMLNVPISDRAAFRIAGQRVRRDGFMSDGTSDDVGEAVRASLLLEPTDNLSILLWGDFAHQGGKGPGATIRKTCASLGRPGTSCFVNEDDPYTAVSDLDAQYTNYGLPVQTDKGFIDGDYYGSGLNIDLQTGIGTVSLIGGWRGSDMSYVGTGIGWQIREKQRPEQKSLELRLASSSTDRLQYVFGAYYLDTKMDARANGENASRKNFSDQDTHLTGWTGALYSQITYGLTDTFRLTGGLRYTYEKKSSDSRRYTLANLLGPDPVIPPEPVGTPANVVQGSREWNEVNWKAGFELDAADDSLIYGNVSTGFKAGGFFYGPPGSQTFEPEKVTSYVLGTKNRFLDNRLQLNAEAFYLDYQNQQISFVKLIGVSSTLVTENAGKSQAYGMEVESQFLITPDTRIGVQAQYLKAEYDSFSYQTLAAPPPSSLCTVTPGTPQASVDCAGVTPLRSPEWTFIGSLEQTIPLANDGRIVLEGLARYESSFETDVNYIPETRTDGSLRIDLGVSYVSPDDRFTIKAYVDNVTDELSITSTTVHNAYPQTGNVAVNLLAPRTFGVRGSVRF